MSTKTKVIGVLEGLVIALGLYSVFMALMTMVVHMAIGIWWYESEKPSPSEALPQVIVFLLLTIAAVVALEWNRRESNEPKPPRLPWFGLMLVGVVAGVLLGHVLWSTAGRMTLRREIASLEAAGLAPPPASNEPAMAEADNAVPLLLEASAEIAKSLPSSSPSQKPLLDYIEHFQKTGEPGPERDAIRLLIAANRSTLDKVAQAADRKGAHWTLDFTPPIVNMPLPDHLPFPVIARLLGAQAIERAESGDIEGAAQSIRAGLAMAEAIGESPLMLSQVYRGVLHGILLGTASRIFDTPAELAIAEPVWSPYLDAAEVLDRAKYALRLDLVSVPREMASGVLGSPASSFPEVGAGYEAIASAPVYYLGMAAVLRDQRPLFEAMAPGKPGLPELPADAPRYLTKAAIGAARIELARGAFAWAKSPGDPAKGVGHDPFADGALHAVSASGGTLIFSVGPDRKDDAGAGFDKEKDTGDLAWLVRPDAPPTVAKNK